jgi:hypothetical protein
MPILKDDIKDHDNALIATDYYPDDTIVPVQDIPDIWQDEVLLFGCYCGNDFASKLTRLFVNMDYFEPEAKCPACKDWCYIKKWH